MVEVPFISKDEIKKRADEFRQKFWGDLLPVNAEDVVEVKLKMKIVPTPNIRRFYGVDAWTAINLKMMYVDNDLFLDNRQKNRLKFSLAHELGHCVLHQNIYKQVNINNIYKFSEILLDLISEEKYNYLEVQANKFANYFLIPRERLKIEKAKLIERLKNDSEFSKLADSKMQNSFLAISLANVFGVSSEAMEIALNED